MSADVRPLRLAADPEATQPALRSVVQCLRNLAGNIEDGMYGELDNPGLVMRAAVVLRVTGQEPVVFGMGDTQIAQTYMDLQAGAQELMNMKSPER